MTLDAWTPARTLLLRRLWKTGKTLQAIADEINARYPGADLTRSAISGKRVRLNLPNKPQENVRRNLNPVKPKPTRRQTLRIHANATPRAEPKPRAAIPEPLHLQPEALNGHTCRFPHGHPRQGLTFCGHHTSAGRVYCDYHHQLCYTKARAPEPAPKHPERVKINF